MLGLEPREHQLVQSSLTMKYKSVVHLLRDSRIVNSCALKYYLNSTLEHPFVLSA